MSKAVSGLLKQKVNGQEVETFLCPYMVGDIFITTNNISPETRYKGTTWQKIEEETFLMNASETYPVKSKGGENKHTLTIAEMPSHTHTAKAKGLAATGNAVYVVDVNGSGTHSVNNYTGGGQPHNNMPKFLAVNMWLRVS